MLLRSYYLLVGVYSSLVVCHRRRSHIQLCRDVPCNPVLVLILHHAYHYPILVTPPPPTIAIVVRKRSKNLQSDGDTCLQLRRPPGGQLLERAPEIYLCLRVRRESENAAPSTAICEMKHFHSCLCKAAAGPSWQVSI